MTNTNESYKNLIYYITYYITMQVFFAILAALSRAGIAQSRKVCRRQAPGLHGELRTV